MSEVNNNTYTIMNNPLLQDTDVIEAAVDVIQQALGEMDSYVPVEVNTFADWAYDAGDIVTIVKDGVDYVMPIFTNALNWNGGSDVTWASSGNPEREIPDAPQRQSYGYGTAITQVETDLDEAKTSFHTYMEQTDTYISLIATEEDIEEAQLVSKSLFQITSGQILSVVAQSGVTSTLPEFDRTKAYAVGDQVQYQGVWLEFVQPHAANTDLVWTEVKTVKTQETRITENTTGVESLVTKTGIGSLGQNETLYSKITQNADAISLVVTSTTGESGVTHTIDTASIVLAINGGTGHSSAYIEADQITLNGNTKITGTVTIDDTNYYGLTVSAIDATGIDCTKFYQGGQGGYFVVCAEAIFYGDMLLAQDGGQVIFGDGDGNGTLAGPNAEFGAVTFTAGEGQGSYSLDTTNVPGMVTDLQLLGPTNNVYTLQKKTVGNNSWTNVGTFSRATQLGGVWGSGTGVLTVTADPQGNQYVSNHYLNFDGNGQSSFSVQMKTQDTGQQSPAERMKMYGYLVLSGSGTSAKVVVGPNSSGSGYVGSLSVGDIYISGWNAALATIRVNPGTDQTISSATTVYAQAKATPTATGYTNYDSVTLTPSGGGGGGGYRVNMRDQPSSGGAFIMYIEQGTTVNSSEYPIGYTYEWFPLKYSGQVGYVMSKFISGTQAYNSSDGNGYTRTGSATAPPASDMSWYEETATIEASKHGTPY